MYDQFKAYWQTADIMSDSGYSNNMESISIWHELEECKIFAGMASSDECCSDLAAIAGTGSEETIYEFADSIESVQSNVGHEEPSTRLAVHSSQNVTSNEVARDAHNLPMADMQIPSERVYRSVFCTEFNLSFFRPKKDQCNECTSFYNTQQSDKQYSQLQNDHLKHITQKDRAQQEKRTDKTRMRESNGEFLTATFDLQSLLQVPSGQTNMLYYKRKLTLYNLTVYDGSQNGYCFLWPETDGKRGSNEIGSIIYKYLENLPKSVKEVSLFSDSCSGQNRNQYMASLLMYAVQNLPLDVIEHKFFYARPYTDGMRFHAFSDRARTKIFGHVCAK
jgi:hypothetical protein